MPGLTIASHDLEVEQFAEGPPINIGEATRAFAGDARSSVRAQKRTFSAKTMPYGKSVYDALLAHCVNDTPVTVAGSCLLGDSLTCMVRITYDLVGLGTAVDGYNFLFQLSLSIVEV